MAFIIQNRPILSCKSQLSKKVLSQRHWSHYINLRSLILWIESFLTSQHPSFLLQVKNFWDSLYIHFAVVNDPLSAAREVGSFTIHVLWRFLVLGDIEQSSPINMQLYWDVYCMNLWANLNGWQLFWSFAFDLYIKLLSMQILMEKDSYIACCLACKATSYGHVRFRASN